MTFLSARRIGLALFLSATSVLAACSSDDSTTDTNGGSTGGDSGATGGSGHADHSCAS
jgi:hypothetical protein